jgi:hypothetical protein
VDQRDEVLAALFKPTTRPKVRAAETKPAKKPR